MRNTHKDAQVHDISRARLVQGLRALHVEYGVYERCAHEHPDNDLSAFYIEGVGWTCDKSLLRIVCRHCCAQDGDGQSEVCAAAHDHLPDHALCPTMALLDGRTPPWNP